MSSPCHIKLTVSEKDVPVRIEVQYDCLRYSCPYVTRPMKSTYEDRDLFPLTCCLKLVDRVPFPILFVQVDTEVAPRRSRNGNDSIRRSFGQLHVALNHIITVASGLA